MSDKDVATSNYSETDIDLLDIVGVLYRRRRFIVLLNSTIILSALAFMVASLLLPPQYSPLPNLYRPHALLLVNDESGASGFQAAMAASGLGRLASLGGVSSGSAYGELAKRLLNGNSVIDTIVEEFGITARYRINRYTVADSRKAVTERASFTVDAATRTLTIAFEDYDPVFARDVVNRFVELLVQRFRTIGTNRSITERDLLHGRLVEVEGAIAVLEDAAEVFQRQHGVVTAQSLASEQIAILAEVRSRLIFKELEIQTYSEGARGTDPVILRLMSERDSLRMLLDDLERGSTRIEHIMPSQQEAPRLAIEFSRLERDLRVQARIFEILTEQYEVAKLNVQGEGPLIQILEMADAPDKKHSPSRGSIMIAVAAGSFFVSIVLAFIVNALSAIRRDPEAMRKITG